MSLPPILVSTEEVAEFAAELSECQVIAIDLEADSMYNYQEKVCLLQFSTSDRTVLIDPLAGAKLTSLKPALANPRIRKIFHAADYDIRSLSRDFDIEINGLFDTMISSQFLGEKRFGLADVVRKYFSVELDKQYQRANWSKRPLPEEMIRYAAEDTCYLHKLVDNLEKQLLEKGRLEWVQEEFALLEKVRFTIHQGPEFLRFKGAKILDRRQLAVLENLLQWRNSEAQRRNCPLYKVIGSKPLLQLAQLMPQRNGNLTNIDGISPRLLDRYGKKILHAVSLALDLLEAELPVYPRGERRMKDPQVEKRIIRLKEWRKQISAELEIDPGVLINNTLLEKLARKQPQTEHDLADIDLLKKWQCKVLGEGILRTLN